MTLNFQALCQNYAVLAKIELAERRSKNPETKLGHIYAEIAKKHGFRTWNAMKAELDKNTDPEIFISMSKEGFPKRICELFSIKNTKSITINPNGKIIIKSEINEILEEQLNNLENIIFENNNKEVYFSKTISNKINIAVLETHNNKKFIYMEKGENKNIKIKSLASIVEAGANIIVFGQTGSGKTTIVSNILQEVDKNKSLTIIESVNEIKKTESVCEKRIKLSNKGEFILKELETKSNITVMDEITYNEEKSKTIGEIMKKGGFIGVTHASSENNAKFRLEFILDPKNENNESVEEIKSNTFFLMKKKD